MDKILKKKKRKIAIALIAALLCSANFGILSNQSDDGSTGKKAAAALYTDEKAFEYVWIETDATSITKGDVIRVNLYTRDIIGAINFCGHLSFDRNVFEEDFDMNLAPGFGSSWSCDYYSRSGMFTVDDNRLVGKYLSGKTLIATFDFTAKKDTDESIIYLDHIEIGVLFDEHSFGGFIKYGYGIYGNAEENIGYACKIPAEPRDVNVGDDIQNGDPVPSLYTDYTHKTPVVKGSVAVYANGKAVTVGDEKIDYSQATMYTDILASYSYNMGAKGKLNASTGKVIAGITISSKKPELIKGKIVDKDAAKIATVSIKHGQIVVKAKSQPGIVHLWVMDTGDLGNCTCCPITVKAAPTALNLYAIRDRDSAFSYGKTKKYTKDTIVVSKAIDVYLYPTYKRNKVDTKVKEKEVSYTISVDDKAADYFTITYYDHDPHCFWIRAKGLKDNKPTTGKITIQCDQNGKKATFTATAVASK